MGESLDGKSVVVIGGTSGIGLATAQLATAAGARVVVVGRDEGRLAAALDTLGGTAEGRALDIADEAAVAGLFGALDAADHIAILAGTHVNGDVAAVDTSILAGPVNNRFWGPLYVCKYAGPKMTAAEGPPGSRSITLCTGAGVARPRKGASIVAAAAGGSEFFARAMALELAPVRVNVVRPGIIDTPLLDRMAGEHKAAVMDAQAKRVPMQRVGTPEEVAEAFVFLMGATYVTGTTLTIDGGFGLT